MDIQTAKATRKARSVITALDVAAVSLVDRPATREPMVMLKSDPAMPSGEPGTAVPQAEGGAPAADAPAATATLVMPKSAKASLGTVAKGACAALEKVSGEIDSATEDDASTVPTDVLSSLMKVAVEIGEAVRPFVASGDDALQKSEWTKEYEDTLDEWHFLLREQRKLPYRYHTYAIYEEGLAVAEAAVLGTEAPWLTDCERVQLICRLLSIYVERVNDKVGLPGKDAEGLAALDRVVSFASRAKAVLAAKAGGVQTPAAEGTGTDPAAPSAPVVEAAPATPNAPVADELTKRLGGLEDLVKSMAGLIVPAATPVEVETLRRSLDGKEQEIATLTKSLADVTEKLAKAQKASPGSGGNDDDGPVREPVKKASRPLPGTDMAKFWKREDSRA